MTTPAPETPRPRAIKSFVIRQGRITEAQQRALAELSPRYVVGFTPQPLDLDALFGRRAPRVIEIGFGNGENLAALAQAHPEQDYLGLEVHQPGVGRLLLAADTAGLRNLKIIAHDAVEVLARQLPPQCLDEVWILFPDPWPKKRHHKRRLIQPAFVELLASRFKPGGVLRLATDWQPYAEHMQTVLSACPLFESQTHRPADRSATKFEMRGRRLGHSVSDLGFVKK